MSLSLINSKAEGNYDDALINTKNILFEFALRITLGHLLT